MKRETLDNAVPRPLGGRADGRTALDEKKREGKKFASCGGQNDHRKDKDDSATSDGTQKQPWQIQVFRELLLRDELLNVAEPDVADLAASLVSLRPPRKSGNNRGATHYGTASPHEPCQPLKTLPFVLAALSARGRSQAPPDQDSGDHSARQYLSTPRVNDAAAVPLELHTDTVAAAGVAGPLGSPRLQRPAQEQHDRHLAALRSLLSAQALHRTAVVQQEHWQTHDAHLVDTRLRQGRVRRLRAPKMASYEA